jgi:RimJ/RimL family protein N-acetyltransferase
MAFDHVGSRRVAEKIGMRREREFVNRRNRDILTYLYAYDVEQPAQGDDERTTP